MATVLVIGGTGTLGREVVSRLVARHHRPRLLNHHQQTSFDPETAEMVRGDLLSGTGLREAIAGVAAIIHCASNPQNAYEVDVGGTRLVLQEVCASTSHAVHIIYPSIVGVDHSTYTYYQAKRAAEVMIEQGPFPWTIARFTQFHDLVLKLIQSSGADTRSVVSVAADMCFQSIAVSEVADALVVHMEQGATGYMLDKGGPQIRTFEEMVIEEIADVGTALCLVYGRECVRNWQSFFG